MELGCCQKVRVLSRATLAGGHGLLRDQALQDGGSELSVERKMKGVFRKSDEVQVTGV